MYKFLNLSLLFILFSVDAQTYIYDLRFKADTLTNDYRNAQYMLLVDEKETKFFDYAFYKQDSINRNNHNKVRTSINSQANLECKRSRNSSISKNYIVIGSDYFVFKTEDNLNWNLKNEVRKVNEYKIQKAELKYGGRNWIAWFSPDIPVSEGPYKFRGLPGLIIEIYDDKNNYHFNLLEVKKNTFKIETNSFLENSYFRIPTEVTYKEIKNTLIKQYEDPYYSVKQQMMKNNQPIDISKQDEDEAREYIKKYNNPIEIDKAVIYK